jgi:hypothetical protein
VSFKQHFIVLQQQFGKFGDRRFETVILSFEVSHPNLKIYDRTTIGEIMPIATLGVT